MDKAMELVLTVVRAMLDTVSSQVGVLSELPLQILSCFHVVWYWLLLFMLLIDGYGQQSQGYSSAGYGQQQQQGYDAYAQPSTDTSAR